MSPSSCASCYNLDQLLEAPWIHQTYISWQHPHTLHQVRNPELGTIVLNRRSIKDSLGHGGDRAKVAAFAAIPDVIRHGIVVDHQVNWKGRGYETYVVAAPVTIGVDRYFVGSVVISPKSGRRFYTHDLIVERESRDGPFKTGSLENEGLPGGTHPGSIKSLLYRIAGVNTQAVVGRAVAAGVYPSSNRRTTFIC